MSQTTKACVRGCTLYRRHLVDCADRDACSGCLPRRAEHGYLCSPCYRRFELMLTDLPTVERWLTGNLPTGTGQKPTDDVRVQVSGDGPPMPIKAEVFDARQALRDLADLLCSHWSIMRRVAEPTRGDLEAQSAFLLRWLPDIAQREIAARWWDWLALATSNAHALAPWRPALRRVPTIPCPECGETNLVIFGGESDVTCLSCRTMIPERRFGLWEQIITEELASGSHH